MNFEEKTIDSKYVYNCKVIDVKYDNVEIADGSKSVRIVVEHPGGVVIVAQKTPDTILMVKQYRYPIKQTVFELPAGKLEKGQTSENDVYFKGKICSIKYTFSAQYGTATFNVSDDGATGGTEFICYSVYTLGNKPWVEGNDQIAVGDVVVICGKITNYNGTLETASKKAYIVSLNKSDSGGGDTGGGDTSGSDLTVTAASLGLENGVEVGTKTLTDGTTLTCAGGSNTNAPKYYSAGNGTVRMYPSNTMTLNAGSKTISSVEIVCNEYNGTLYNASGNVTTTSGAKAIDGASVKFTGINSSTVTITNAAEGSGAATQIRWESLKITYAN